MDDGRADLVLLGPGSLFTSVADLIDRDLEELATEETRNTGKAMRESRLDMADVAKVFRYYARLAGEEADSRPVDAGNPEAISRIVHEPVGVCAGVRAGPVRRVYHHTAAVIRRASEWAPAGRP